MTSASLSHRVSALAAAVLAFAFAEETIFSCFFARLSDLRTAVAAFLSSASFFFISFAALRSVAILVFVGVFPGKRLVRGPGGAWISGKKESLLLLLLLSARASRAAAMMVLEDDGGSRPGAFDFSLLIWSGAGAISFDDRAALGIEGVDEDGLIDGHGGMKNGGGFAADVLAGEIDLEETGGCGFCVVLCVPTPSR